MARVLVSIAESICRDHQPFEPPLCLLLGGETTVTVRGGGSGGRNQELALSALQQIGSCESIFLLSAGTDGVDGTTTAAGAMADSGFHRAALAAGLSIADALEANDSHAVWRQVGGLVETGPTGTNVMDLVILIVEGRS